MMDDGLAAKRRRWFPTTVRLRLSLLYAGLFLAAGAVLLALTYGLVAGSLSANAPRAKATSAKHARLKATCTAGERISQRKTKTGLVTGKKVPKACLELEAAAASAATAAQRTRVLGDLLLFSLIGLGALTLCSGGLGWLMAGRVLRPVVALTGAARRASERHLGERLNLTGPRDELKELADTFDGMLERLDAAFASQKRFVADASHELRTPLTLMRTSIDVTLAKPTRSPEALEAMATKIQRSVDRAESLIDALLTLAVSERELTTVEEVDLATAAEDALDAAARAIEARALSVTTDLAEARTFGDRILLERLTANLVDNALRHNRPGGGVDVATGTTADGRVCLSVANGGEVLPQDSVESLFEPFRTVRGRVRGSEGFGLGLAIVKSIATAHGAEVDAHARPEGGLAVTVVFPSASNDGPAAATTPATERSATQEPEVHRVVLSPP